MKQCDYLKYDYCLGYMYGCDSCKYCNNNVEYLKAGGCKLECDDDLPCEECHIKYIINKNDRRE